MLDSCSRDVGSNPASAIWGSTKYNLRMSNYKECYPLSTEDPKSYETMALYNLVGNKRIRRQNSASLPMHYWSNGT